MPRPTRCGSLLADLDGATPALCTHGDVVEALLGERLSLKKGAARVLELLDGELRLGEEIPPPDLELRRGIGLPARVVTPRKRLLRDKSSSTAPSRRPVRATTSGTESRR